MNLAAAQIIPVEGNVEANLIKHQRLLRMAAKEGVQVLVFPELSLTGYILDLADELEFQSDDNRLVSLKDLARELHMIVILGAPVRLNSSLHIGSFILFPDGTLKIYTKHHLHPGEEKIFTPGDRNLLISLDNHIMSLAICADIAHQQHVAQAAARGSHYYLTSVFITESGHKRDTRLLRDYAQEYNMVILMANYGGPFRGYESAGRSSIWSSDGLLIVGFDGLGEGLVIARRLQDSWKGKIIRLE